MKKLFVAFILTAALFSCKTSSTMHSAENIKVHAVRLKPGQDLRAAIEAYVKENNIAAGWLVTCAGSLTDYNIRFANQQNGSSGSGHFEIVTSRELCL